MKRKNSVTIPLPRGCEIESIQIALLRPDGTRFTLRVPEHPDPSRIDAAAVAARNAFYDADRGPVATKEWREVVHAAIKELGR